MPTRRLITLLATVVSLALCAAAQAAPVWTPPTNLSTIADPFGEPISDVAPSGEAAVVVSDDLGAGKHGVRVGLRPPGGAFSEQVLPLGGSAQVPAGASVDVDLVAGGQGIVAWQQANGLFYALRSPGGAFGAPQQVTGLPTAGLGSVEVALDGA